MLQSEKLLKKIQDVIISNVLDKKIGIAFSGGVDSTLLAKVCADLGYKINLITIGFDGSHDIWFSSKVNEFLKLPHKINQIKPSQFLEVVSKIKSKLKTKNLSWIENCIAFYFVTMQAKELGIKTVVTANGIDELFCGYNAYRDAIKKGENEVMNVMELKIKNEIEMMKVINDICSEFGVVLVQPFLSWDFVEFAKSIPISEKIKDKDDLIRKHVIRKLAVHTGVPQISAQAKKKALQYGSLIHKTLVKSS